MIDIATLGQPIGEAFVTKRTDGEIIDEGQYCGFPVVIRLAPDTKEDKRGYRVMIHSAPKGGAHA